MPPKVEDHAATLAYARAMRDRALKSITEIHAAAQEARSDNTKLSSFSMRNAKLEYFVAQFRTEQSSIVRALVALDRLAELDIIDDPIVTSMETMCYEIDLAASQFAQDDRTTTSSTITITQPSVSLPKIQLPKFDGSLLQWRSFRDIYVSLVHDNTTIGDAERFHYLISCLTGSALGLIRSVPLSADNYKVAWEALSNRFDNKRMLASAHVDKLFEFKPMTQESVASLMAFINTFQENVSIIKSLGVEDLASFLLFHMGSRVLHPTTLQLFESSISRTTIPEFEELMKFVQHRCQILESLKNTVKIDRPEKSREKMFSRGKTVIPTKSVFTTTTSASFKSTSRNCLMCNKTDHVLQQCPTFKQWTVDKRREYVTSRKLCFACMHSSHVVDACSSKKGCASCGSRRHNSLLHRNQEKPAVQDSSTVSVSPDSQTSSNVTTSFAGTSRANSTVVLGTAVIHIKDAWGRPHAVRALLDSGSQISAITSDCLARLDLPKRAFSTHIVGLAQNPVAHVQGITSCQFSSHFEPDRVFPSVDLVVLTQITAAMPSSKLPTCVRDKYRHLLLADRKFDTPARIDVLFGADVFPRIVRSHAGVEHHIGFPSALDTMLGWVVFGSIAKTNDSPLVALTTTVVPPISDLLQKFWAIEEPPAPVAPTTEDQWCEEHFLKSTSRDQFGRFCVALPFRDLFRCSDRSRTSSSHGLGDSRSIALKRFYNLELRLVKEPELYIAYRKFMSDYQTLGHMRPAPEPGRYIIPHHAVLKSDGDVSKLRVVFDASAATSSGKSLNDVLCTGPKLQTDLRDILLRSRMHKYILTADIVKMYRQILIRPEDRLYQHIFWRDSQDDEIKEFQLCTITYGLNCAPYLAIRCLHELDKQEGQRFPYAMGVLTQSTYVDDIIVGADSEEQLLRRKNDLIGLLHSASCELKKWTSNSTVVLDSVFPDDCANTVSFDPKNDHSVKVLGLHWDTHTDNFAYHTQVQETSSTKRKVLSVIARLFDPIGALGPMLLWAKCFMQQLWSDGLDWDDQLPTHLLCEWQQFLSELPSIFNLTLPRHIDITCYQDVQLLGFADASIKGYAATVYLRIVHGSGRISVHFISSKNKVAPLKGVVADESLSIPRLELCGALLLAQTLHHVHQVLSTEISISRLRAWSDSSIVLSWLTADQKYFKIFVTNRVAKVHHLLPNCDWNYVSTNCNPADPASRGLLPMAMMSSTIFWNGPTFLLLPEDQWPGLNFTFLKPEQLPETKPKTVTVLSASIEPVILDPFHRFSSLAKLQRVLAYVFRFFNRLRQQSVCTGPVTLPESDKILLIVIQQTQQHYFSGLFRQLKNSSIVTPPSLAQLAPFVDDFGILRVGGRLRFSSLSHDAKHPILLPRSSHLTHLVILHYHLSFLHGGPKLILSMLNHKYWILSGRAAVRQCIFSCVPCTRHRAVRPHPVMADLPSFRVQPHRPFSHVGMDYGGPFTVKEHRRRNARPTKVYLALFICMSVKAVHLEVVSDLTTDAFLAALDRFVARRGIPTNIYSDCGTNYIGAARQLKALFRDAKEQNRLVSHLQCTWHFNPPAAPHFGGIWEAGIKGAKFHLKHVIGTQILTYEEFQTLVTRIEGILNSRPITPISSDPHDLCALTPGHFLVGQPIHALPESDIIDVQTNHLNRWQLIRQCHQSYWKRWSREYLATLQARQKWFKPSPNIAVNDMVVVEAPNRPPTEWRLGRVTEVHPGLDNTVRVVSVRTQDGTYKRPVVKIVKLPIEQ